jgi:hypothetical protein
MNNNSENIFPFLRIITTQPKQKTSHTKPQLLPDNIKGIRLEKSYDYFFVWFIDTNVSFYDVSEISTVELKAIEEFIKKRLANTLPPPLSTLKPCERSDIKEGTRVFVQYDALSPKCLGKIENYAERQELGDSWLVRFLNGSSQYIPSNIIYKDESNILQLF